MSALDQKHFIDEQAAYKYVESSVWPDGLICPHCGETERLGRLKGKSTRPGVYKCYACRKPFTVKIGTIFESSHIPLHTWLQAIFLMASSKKGISSNQLHRTLGITLKSAWFLSHRIREAMRPDGYQGPMGPGGGTVEADETYIGGKPENRPKHIRSKKHLQPKKRIVFSLVERGGQVRSFHVKSVSARSLRPILRLQISQSANLRTDEWRGYYGRDKDFASHETVNHSALEYVRGDAHTNTIESYFSILKRGLTGTYQHVSAKHLKRYLGEFDFRYNERKALGVEDIERAEKALKGIVGKRLAYRTTRWGHSEVR